MAYLRDGSVSAEDSASSRAAQSGIRDAALGDSVAQGAAAFAKLRTALCEGSCAQVALKLTCAALMSLPGAAAGFIYLFVTRGWRLLKWMCRTGLPRCLLLAHRGLKGTLGALAVLAEAVRSCWTAIVDWIARHLKHALYVLHDALVAPVVRAVHTAVLAPLQTASLVVIEASWERCAKPLGKWWCEKGGPACFRAARALCTALGNGAAELDCIATEAAWLAYEGLAHAWHALWPTIADSVRAVGRALHAAGECAYRVVLLPAGQRCWAAGSWLGEHVVRPLGQATTAACVVLGDAASAVAQWLYTNVLVVVGSALARLLFACSEALGKVAVALWQASAQLLGALWRCLAHVVPIAFNALSTTFTATVECVAPFARAVWGVLTTVVVAAATTMTAVVGGVGTAAAAAAAALWTAAAAIFVPLSKAAYDAALVAVAVGKAVVDVVVTVANSLVRCIEALTGGKRAGTRQGDQHQASDLI